MDELYGLHSSVDNYYSTQQIEDNMVSNWSSYGDFSSHVVNFDDRDVYTDYYSKNNGDDGGVYGSDQLWSSAGGSSGLSDAGSVGMVAENNFIIQRNNNNNNNNNKDNNKNINNDDNGLSSEEDVSSVIREKIASHHLYPKLLRAYIDCRMVGAPPEMADILDDIKRGTDDNASERNVNVLNACGSDPELDDFMETYCDILVKYKSDLSKPFDEAATFLSSMETQLSKLCDGVSFGGDGSAEGIGFEVSSEEDNSGDEIEMVDQSCRSQADHELKDKLLQKYSGYISGLKHEFSKRKKNGKLPKEARQTLFQWWNIHYKWPYPTESDKIELAESTRLDQKQINNWFINQRKRHWKPSDCSSMIQCHQLCGPNFYS